MERLLLEYLVNSVWQVPLVTAAAWLAGRVGRPAARVQHAVWLVALVTAVALPAVSLYVHPRPTGALADAASRENTPAIEPPLAPQSVTAELNVPEPQLEATSAEHAIDGESQAERRAWFSGREWTLSPTDTQGVELVYLGVCGFCLLRLLRSWYVARITVRDSILCDITARDAATLRRCCDELGLAVPEVRVSPHTRSPLVLGILRPVLLLPPDLMAEERVCDIEAVWWHELVHIRRHDYFANLVCRVWALPIAYHPAAYVIARRVARTREMVCDSTAAARMDSPVGYARSLVDLAQRMNSGDGAGLAGTAMFGDGALEERVMELLRHNATGSIRARALRVTVSAATSLVVLGAAVMFHVTPTMAKAQPPLPAVSPAAGVAPAPVARPVAEVAPNPVAAVAPISAAIPVAEAAPAQAASPVQKPERVQRPEPVQPVRELTPEQRERIDKQMSDVQRRIADALKKLNDGDLQKEVEEAMQQFNSGDFQKKMADAMAEAKALNSAELQKQIAVALAAAQAQWNSPEFQERLKEKNGPELRKRIDEAAGRAKANAELFANSAEFQKRMAEMQRQLDQKFNSPEWKKQMEQLNSPQFREQMERMQRQLKDAMKNLEEQQKKLQSSPPEERNSPQAREESLQLEGDVARAYLALASADPQGRKLQAALVSGSARSPAIVAPAHMVRVASQAALGNDTDETLYKSGMDELERGEYDAARRLLQRVVSGYPDSRYAVEAKRAIAQSWDAQGTLALVHAEEQYEAAGVGAKKLGSGITPPVLVSQVNPEYTPEAKAAKVHGAVAVNLWVDEHGKVQHVRVVRGPSSGLDEKAIDAVRQYKFKPAIEDGKPVMVALNVEVNFQIF
jgi:TonB family protein